MGVLAPVVLLVLVVLLAPVVVMLLVFLIAIFEDDQGPHHVRALRAPEYGSAKRTHSLGPE